MRKLGGPFGLIVLIIVLLVVMMLATKAWERMAPTARQISNPGVAEGAPAHGQQEAAEELNSSGLPDMDEMRENTSEHADQVHEILEQAE